MKKKLLVSCKYLCALCFLVSMSFAVNAQTKTVWVFPTGTYDVVTLEKIEGTPVVASNGSFSSDDYAPAVDAITDGIVSRVFKDLGTFTAPEGYVMTKFTVYGWSRYNGAAPVINSIKINNGEEIIYTVEDSPYVFEAQEENVAAGNRTVANCSIFEIAGISEESPATTITMNRSREVHVFHKIVLSPASADGVNNVYQSKRFEEGVYYNVMGQKVDNPTQGIYILNGQKIFINNK